MNKFIFYIEKFSYCNSSNSVDLSFVDRNLKRRLSELGRCAFYNLNACFDETIENIVFASQELEPKRLEDLINQYEKNNEVSPFNFSTSVLNATVGLFSIFKKYDRAYTAQSASINTISNGLLTSIISNYNNVLFCYSDLSSNPVSFGVKISKEKSSNSKKFALSIKNNEFKKDEIKDYIELFLGEKDKLSATLFDLEVL